MSEEMIILRRFGKQLRSFRKQKMISRAELGNQIRLSEEEVSELEAGILDPSLSMMMLIAKVLQIRPEDLFLPNGGNGSQYYAYRCYLLKLINNLPEKDIRVVIEFINSLSSDRK